MNTATVKESVDIEASAEVVWSVVTDWPRQREWMLGTEVHLVSGDGRGTGSRMVAFTGVGGLGALDPMEITEWSPPHRCVVRHTGRLVRGEGIFEVVARGPAASTFLWSERLVLPFGPLGRWGWPAVRPGFAWGLRRSGQRLAELCRREAG
ncbi:SRPBCC family protein [Actinoalloteichus spitiensis]|uniref:SRPBCC family protein n=1 Tax=Actinoalloteichus spitiensis TaxID=252394 RepID=UPI0003666549|nr:SRPBCC family protein [Actinoalloteichus spitiensis]